MLLSVFLSGLAFFIGSKKEIDVATKRANEKWLPQAESVIYRLLTLQTNVKRFAISSKNNCKQTVCDLPELDQDNMKAVKIKIQTDCVNTSERLSDIVLQLDDAVGDWSRFVAENCDGSECNRIFDAIAERQYKLEEDLQPETSEEQ